MDYGIENTTHDKAYFDEIDKEQAKEEWLQNRTSEIAAEIADDEHQLYSVSDCVREHIYDGDDEDLHEDYCQGLCNVMTNNSLLLKLTLNNVVFKQARILAEGELAELENKDDL